MTITELVTRCYDQTVRNGWTAYEVPIPEQVALICSEATEALESFRNNEKMSWTSDTGKPEGIGSEFADILIRVGHYSRLNGIDLDYEVERKLAYNETRSRRHGGKRA